MTDKIIKSIADKLKATPIWVMPEDKLEFERLILDRKAETAKPVSHAEMFNLMLKKFMEGNNGRKSK